MISKKQLKRLGFKTKKYPYRKKTKHVEGMYKTVFVLSIQDCGVMDVEGTTYLMDVTKEDGLLDIKWDKQSSETVPHNIKDWGKKMLKEFIKNLKQ